MGWLFCVTGPTPHRNRTGTRRATPRGGSSALRRGRALQRGRAEAPSPGGLVVARGERLGADVPFLPSDLQRGLGGHQPRSAGTVVRRHPGRPSRRRRAGSSRYGGDGLRARPVERPPLRTPKPTSLASHTLDDVGWTDARGSVRTPRPKPSAQSRGPRQACGTPATRPPSDRARGAPVTTTEPRGATGPAWRGREGHLGRARPCASRCRQAPSLGTDRPRRRSTCRHQRPRRAGAAPAQVSCS